ncbi:MAG TPA: heavy metal translocating P-type ATPase metal-binding domain-containing protein, partial [Cyclobacteriaceae bacterium]|nr:heavy metal translocating P-type ATPase metal-binding domain-containing protein [Cyclobacteriaceae bacterium]
MKDEPGNDVISEVACFHCGQPCNTVFHLDEKSFCCFGCKTVYEIISSKDMCEYYSMDSTPGVKQDKFTNDNYIVLDKPEVYKKIIEFDSPSFARVRFSIPSIHCSSCIWLLENLRKFDEGIVKSEVNFTRKTVVVDFNPRQVQLSKVASILQSIGYAPVISLEREATERKKDYSLVLKLGLAGFCFGNVMLFSFPEYLGLDSQDQFKNIFPWLNLLLSIPVLVYSASLYFVSAWKAFRQKQINIDVPIAAGLIALFFRSTYDIITATGSGYLDSFTGLVFFLLIGRWFQSKTYESLSFDRDFKSYFPLAVNKVIGHEYSSVLIHQLVKGDRIRIKNMEIIPADSILESKEALIDYSFVTGESKPVRTEQGELVYAGGRLLG